MNLLLKLLHFGNFKCYETHVSPTCWVPHRASSSVYFPRRSQPILINPFGDLLQALSPSSTSTLPSQASSHLSIPLLHLHQFQLQKSHLFPNFIYLFWWISIAKQLGWCICWRVLSNFGLCLLNSFNFIFF